MPVIAQGPAVSPITGTTGGVFNVIPGEPGAGAQAALNLLGSGKMNGQQFQVKASGLVSLAAGTYTATVQPLVYASTTNGFTAAVGSAIYSAAAVNVTVSAATAKLVPWFAVIELEGDSTSGLLNGIYHGNMNNGAQQLVDFANIANAPTSINFSTEPPLQFAIGTTLTNGGTGTVCSILEWEIVGD